jgi:putative phage-type endonuclease
MKVIVCQQGTDEWHEARLGKVSASRVSEIVAKTRSGAASTSRKNYMAELLVERLTGERRDGFSNGAMRWGSEYEDEARSLYSFLTGLDVEEVGLVMHPGLDNACASPDGLVAYDGLVEIKCPTTSTHIETLQKRKVPSKYIDQMQWQMACTGAKWCDFVSYDPRLPTEMQVFIKRVERDDDHILALETAVDTFLNELDMMIRELQQDYPSQADQVLAAA